MTTQAIDPRLRTAPRYIGWVPGTVDLLRSAPKVPGSHGGAAGAGSKKPSAGSGDNWASLSGQS